ncbi:helix-turn-helix domain-containing protein [Gordonia sp. CPCC 205515]|uniref:PucR family transcriptional regulator n=1 Tax=Gordonia sp. CPCC 205515 TaxID=3140791 RepID=UPI003AF39DBF
MPTTDSAATVTWLVGFVAAQREPAQVSLWVERTMAEILGAVTGIPADLHPRVRAAIGDHWRAFLDRVATPDSDFVLVDSAHELAGECARLHIPLPVLLHVYQTAQTASWQFAVDVVGQAPPDVDHEAAIITLWTKANAWFASSIDQSVAVYTEEADRVRRRGDARRYEAVAKLLDGTDVAISELSAALDGHPITSVDHVAVIAHAMSPESIEALDAAVAAITRSLRAPSVVVRPGGRELWAWIAVRDRDAVDLTAIAVDRVDPAAVRITAGVSGEGIAGFVAAHRDARTAARIALAPRRHRAMTAYDDVTAVTLLAADPSAAQRFVRSRLRELGEPEHEKLRETARAVLTATGGADGVADTLGVHRNTVRYRVAQIERMIGRPLPERAGDILLALDYHDAFGA